MCKAHLSWPGSPTYLRMPTFWIDISLDWATLSAQSCLVSFLRSVKDLFACRVRLPFEKRAKVRQFCGNVKIWKVFFEICKYINPNTNRISVYADKSGINTRFKVKTEMSIYPQSTLFNKTACRIHRLRSWELSWCHTCVWPLPCLDFFIAIISWCPLWGLFLRKID